MPINPIDMMMMPPKSQETSQLQNANNQKMIHAQEQAGMDFKKEVQHNTQKPVQAARKENKEYRYDAKEKGSNSYSGSQKKKDKNNKTEEKVKEKISRSSFDITI